LLLCLVQLAPRQPQYGVPPIQARRQDLQRARPVIATAQMGQFMQQEGGALVIAQVGKQA
jgi:hypothetical protein